MLDIQNSSSLEEFVYNCGKCGDEFSKILGHCREYGYATVDHWDYFRGLLENSSFTNTLSRDKCYITATENLIAIYIQNESLGENLTNFIKTYCTIHNEIEYDNDMKFTKILFESSNVYDLLSKLYDNKTIIKNIGQNHLYELYGKIPRCKFSKTYEDACIPEKNWASDEGYDLTITKEHKKISSKTSLYNTGISVEPPNGYYTIVVPRSSISKSGYIMSNSHGVIDKSYRGPLLIALTKIDDSLPDLKLPFKCGQLILQKSTHFLLDKVEELISTKRGNGGFGSTRI
jgi:deoxyuridine 5'-triphosphate nucleotidohydrolase